MNKRLILSTIVGAAFAICTSPGSLAEEPIPPEGTAAGLFEYANQYAARKGYTFGDGAEHMLNQAANSGANDIQATDPEFRAARIEEARRNFAHYIDLMIESSKEIPGYANDHPGKLGEQTFFRAAKKLCPLWPICK